METNNHEEVHHLPEVHLKYYENLIRLSKERIIFLAEDFTKEVSSSLSAMLLYYNNQDPEEIITIYIHSDGGDIAALTNIYDVIQMISAPVRTVCIGKCYSAGAILLAAGTKGERYIMPHAEVMLHKIQCGFPLINKTQIDHESYMSFLKTVNDRIMRMISKHTGQPLKKIKEDFLGSRELFLDAKQTIAYGLADKILT